MTRIHLILFVIITFGFSFFGKAQSKNPPDVELIEEKLPKRWMLYAQNNTDEEQEAFLIVQSQGFRRSADRPVIKKVPPRGKVLMITLIPLQGASPTYTKIFKHETSLQSINKRKGEGEEDAINIRSIKEEEFTVFIDEDCEKCQILIDFLNKNHYKYRTLNINTNHKVNEFLFDHLKDSDYKGGIIDLPSIIYRGKKHWSIPNINIFIKEYGWESLERK